MALTSKQQKIVRKLAGEDDEKPEPKKKLKAERKVQEDGSVRYMGLPGTTIVGIGGFPRTVKDPEIQKRIEGSRSFKRGHIWIDSMSSEEVEQAEEALKNLPLQQLQKLAFALGHRNINRLNKVQLIEVCTREGASLL